MNRWIAAVVLMLMSGAAHAQKSVVEGYQTYQNPGLQFSGVGGQGEVAGFSQGNVTTASVAVSSFIIGTYSAPWPTSPGWVTVENQSNSSGILYVAPLGGTCSTTTDIPIAVGGSYSFLNPSSAMTVCSSSTATADIIWKGPGISPPIPGAYPGAALDYNFATGNYYPATFSLTVTSAVDASGTWHQFASGVARITSGVGLTVEESRTNSIRSNVSATNWTLSTLNNVTLSAGSPFVSQGVTFVPVTLNGTANASSTVCPILLEATTQISAAQNQVWSESAFVTTSGRVPAVLLDINERNSGGTSVNDNQTAISPSAIFTRYQTSASLSNSGTAYTVPEICFTTVNTTAYSGTINIGWPQIEKVSIATTAAQAFASTPIVTSGSAATRAADVITVSLPSGACSASVCSMIATGTPAAPAGYTQNQVIGRIDDGSSANINALFRGSVSGNPYLFQFIASTGYGGITPGTVWSSSTSGKMADLLTPTSGIIVFNNGTPASQTTPSLPAFTTLRFGFDLGGSAFFNGTIARVAVASVSLLND